MNVCCTLSWLVSDPHTLVMFGNTSDHPDDVQFLLMLPGREEEMPRFWCSTSCSYFATSLKRSNFRGFGSVPDREPSERALALNKPLGAYIMFSHQCKSEQGLRAETQTAIWSLSGKYLMDSAGNPRHTSTQTEDNWGRNEDREPQIPLTCITKVFDWRYPKRGLGLIHNFIFQWGNNAMIWLDVSFLKHNPLILWLICKRRDDSSKLRFKVYSWLDCTDTEWIFVVRLVSQEGQE